jgi:hypothetical protein
MDKARGETLGASSDIFEAEYTYSGHPKSNSPRESDSITWIDAISV